MYKLICFLVFVCLISNAIAQTSNFVGVGDDSRHGGSVSLCQTGDDSIEGAYSGIGIIKGTVVGNRLTGTWYSAGVEENSGAFSLTRSGSKWQGYYVQGSSEFTWTISNIQGGSTASSCFLIDETADHDLVAHWSFRVFDEEDDDEGTEVRALDLCEDEDEEDEGDTTVEGSGDNSPDNYWYLEGDFMDNKKTFQGNVWRADNQGGEGRFFAGIGLIRQISNNTILFWHWEAGQSPSERRSLEVSSFDGPYSEYWYRYVDDVEDDDGNIKEEEEPEKCDRNDGIPEGKFSFSKYDKDSASTLSTLFTFTFAIATIVAFVFQLL